MRSKYETAVYLPKCDICESNIIPPERYYFVAIKDSEYKNVVLVHRECYKKYRKSHGESELLED